jgi:hypothetical protein
VRFVPLQHTLAATRSVPGCHARATIPLRRFTSLMRQPAPLLVRTFWRTCRPCGFTLSSGAKRRRSTQVDVRGGWSLGPREEVAQVRPLNERSITTFRRRSISVQASSGEPISRAHVDPTWSEAPSLRSAARGGLCTVAFLRRGVPLPNAARALAAWPIRWVLISHPVGGARGVRADAFAPSQG